MRNLLKHKTIHTEVMQETHSKNNIQLKKIDEFDSGPMIFRLYEGRIFHGIIKYGEQVGLEDIQPGYDFVERNGGGKFYNIFEFGSFSDLEPEIREWSADPKGNKYTLADAIVVTNLAQKMMADFYVRFNKPPKPTKVFSSFEKAVQWIKTLNLHEE
jgi:hypothetical protein